MNDEIVSQKPKPLSIIGQTDAERLLSQAIDKGVPIEMLERLLVMRDKIEAERARKLFYEALSEFQSKCPIIPKSSTARITTKTGGQYSYKYAQLDEIVSYIRPILKEVGLSFTIQTKFEGSDLITSCIVHHIAGHSEASDFRVPLDREAKMSLAQQNGAANTFSKRYAICNALGILTGEEDTDASLDSKPGIVPRTRPAAIKTNGTEPELESVEMGNQLAHAMGDQADGACSADQRRTIIALFQDRDIVGRGAVVNEIEKKIGVRIDSTAELTEAQANQLIDMLKADPKAGAK